MSIANLSATLAHMSDMAARSGAVFAAVAVQIHESSTQIWNDSILVSKASEGILSASDLVKQAKDIMNGASVGFTKVTDDARKAAQAVEAQASDLTTLVDSVIDSNPDLQSIDPEVQGYLYKAVQVSQAVKAARLKGDANTVNEGLAYLKGIAAIIQKFDPKIFTIDGFLNLVEQATTKAVVKVTKASGGTGNGGTGGFGLGSLLPTQTPPTPNNPDLTTLTKNGAIRG